MDAKKLASLFDNPNFKSWFGASKAVDESGAPLVAYHGTGKTFSEFDPSTQSAGQLGKGFYFSPRPEGAEFFQKLRKMKDPNAEGGVIAAHLKMENPYVFNDYGDIPLNGINQDVLRGMGYDGVIVKRNGDLSKGEMTVFDPTQIKSVDNVGTFDPTNPNIYKSALPYALAGGGLMSALSPSQAQAIENIRAKDLPLEEAWNPIEAFGGGLGGGLRAALAGIVPDGAMDWAINGLMSGGK